MISTQITRVVFFYGSESCSGLTALPTNRCSPSCMNCFFYFLLLIIVASDCCRSSPSLLFIYNNSSYLCILSYLYHITHSQVMGPVSFRPYMATINSFCQSDGCKARVFKPSLAALWSEVLPLVDLEAVH